MRLINVNTYEIREFFGDSTIQKYAILSHTWGEEEVTLQDMQQLADKAKNMQQLVDGVKIQRGFRKIVYTCEQAKQDGLSWAWVDTCCT
jgi:hypothetical protein